MFPPEITDAALLALVNDTAKHANVVNAGDDLRDVLLKALLEVASQDSGVVLSIATNPITVTDVLYVSPRVLNWLDYPNAAAYKATLASGTLIHPDDLPVVESHVSAKSSAVYDARMLRGNGSGTYRNARIQGWSIIQGKHGNAPRTVRVTVIWPRP